MLQKFKSLDKLVRIILLVVPFVNWIVEIVLRCTNYAEKKDTASLILAIVSIFFFGNILGWVDAVWTLLKDDLVLLNWKL